MFTFVWSQEAPKANASPKAVAPSGSFCDIHDGSEVDPDMPALVPIEPEVPVAPVVPVSNKQILDCLTEALDLIKSLKQHIDSLVSRVDALENLNRAPAATVPVATAVRIPVSQAAIPVPVPKALTIVGRLYDGDKFVVHPTGVTIAHEVDLTKKPSEKNHVCSTTSGNLSMTSIDDLGGYAEEVSSVTLYSSGGPILRSHAIVDDVYLDAKGIAALPVMAFGSERIGWTAYDDPPKFVVDPSVPKTRRYLVVDLASNRSINVLRAANLRAFSNKARYLEKYDPTNLVDAFGYPKSYAKDTRNVYKVELVKPSKIALTVVDAFTFTVDEIQRAQRRDLVDFLEIPLVSVSQPINPCIVGSINGYEHHNPYERTGPDGQVIILDSPLRLARMRVEHGEVDPKEPTSKVERVRKPNGSMLYSDESKDTKPAVVGI